VLGHGIPQSWRGVCTPRPLVSQGTWLSCCEYPDWGTASGTVSGIDLTPARILCLDTDWEAIAAERGELHQRPDNLALRHPQPQGRGPRGCCSPSCEPLGAQAQTRQLRTKDGCFFVSNFCSSTCIQRFGSTTSRGSAGQVTRISQSFSPRDFAAEQGDQRVVLDLTTLFNHLSKEVPSAFSSVRHLLFGGCRS